MVSVTIVAQLAQLPQILDPQHDWQVVHLDGCSTQVAHGELQSTQVDEVFEATEPAGQLL